MSLKRKSGNSILMTRNYLDLGSASDWLKFNFLNQSEALPRIRVVTRHQYAIFSALSSIVISRGNQKWRHESACLQREGLTLVGLA